MTQAEKQYKLRVFSRRFIADLCISSVDNTYSFSKDSHPLAWNSLGMDDYLRRFYRQLSLKNITISAMGFHIERMRSGGKVHGFIVYNPITQKWVLLHERTMNSRSKPEHLVYISDDWYIKYIFDWGSKHWSRLYLEPRMYAVSTTFNGGLDCGKAVTDKTINDMWPTNFLDLADPDSLYPLSRFQNRVHRDWPFIKTARELLNNDVQKYIYANIIATSELYQKIKKEEDKMNNIFHTDEVTSIYNSRFYYQKVIFSPPATIVIWENGDKTMVRCSPDETYDPEKGLALCFMKRAFFDSKTSKYHKLLQKETRRFYDQVAKKPTNDFKVSLNNLESLRESIKRAGERVQKNYNRSTCQ